MAIYNEILVGRFARALQKITGIKGGVPAKQLSGEVMPVFPLFWGAENRYLESWQRFGFNGFIAAAATFISVAQFRNPVGSNVVAIFEKIVYINANGTAQQFILGYSISRSLDYGNIFPASTNFARLDARGIQNTTLIGSWSNAVAAVGTPNIPILAVVLVANTGTYDVMVTDNQEITLLPGDCIQFYTASANNILDFSVIWRERFLEDSERT